MLYFKKNLLCSASIWGPFAAFLLEHSTRVTFPFLNCFLPPSLHTQTRRGRVGESSSRVLQRNIISAWHPSWGRDAPTLAQSARVGAIPRGWLKRTISGRSPPPLAARRRSERAGSLSLGSDSLLEAQLAGALAWGVGRGAGFAAGLRDADPVVLGPRSARAAASP